MEERIVTARAQEEDTAELSLRPRRLDEYIGQTKVKENLRILLVAAQQRDEMIAVGRGNDGQRKIADRFRRADGIEHRSGGKPIRQRGCQEYG